MEDMNYRASATQKINKTSDALAKLIDMKPEDTTLKMVGELILERMKFMDEVLRSWYRDGIEDDWDAETIHVGKAACLGNIDSLELLVADIEYKLKI